MLLLSDRATCRFRLPLRNSVAARRSHSPDHARRPAPRSSGQGPRYLRLRRSPADRRHRSHLGVRLRPRLRHSRQGQGAHADLGVLVRAHAARSSPNHLLSTDAGDVSPATRGAPPTAARPLDARRGGPSRCRSSASRAAICRVGLEGLRRRPARSAASRCRPGCANPIGCPSRSSRRRPRRRAATTSTSARRRPPSSSAGACSTRVRELTLRLYAEGAAHAESLRHHRRRHEVRVRPAAGDGRPVEDRSS